MSYNHGTYGWEEYEAYVRALRDLGTSVEESEEGEVYSRGLDNGCMCYCGHGSEEETCEHCTGTCKCEQALRMAQFTTADGRRMVVEEYLAVDDQDCDGSSRVSIEVYEEGHRPQLHTQVLEA